MAPCHGVFQPREVGFDPYRAVLFSTVNGMKEEQEMPLPAQEKLG